MASSQDAFKEENEALVPCSFLGGPVPVYGLEREHLEEDLSNPLYRPLPKEEDEEWKMLVRCGGAGEVADTPEEQQDRYFTENPMSPETHPGRDEYMDVKPDIVITCSIDYLIRTWDANNNFNLLQEFEGHLNFVNQVVPYREDQILSCSDDYTCRLWKIGVWNSKELPDEKDGEERIPSGELLFTYWINMFPMKAVCALPGQRAAVGGLDKTVRIFSLVTGCTLFRMTGHRDAGPERSFFQLEGCGAIWCFLHLRDNLIVSGADDATVRCWDIDTGSSLCTKIGHMGYGEDIGEPGIGWKLSERFATVLKMCHLGQDGRQFATCSYDRTVVIWDASSPNDLQVLRKWKAHGNGILSVCYAGKGVLATCSGDKTVKIWDWTTAEMLGETKTRGIANDACMVDEDRIFIAGGDATVRIYNWKQDKDEKQFYAHDMTLQGCAPVCKSRREDPKNWTKVPIMYLNVKYPENEADSKTALETMRKVLYNALHYTSLG